MTTCFRAVLKDGQNCIGIIVPRETSHRYKGEMLPCAYLRPAEAKLIAYRLLNYCQEIEMGYPPVYEPNPDPQVE